MARPLRRAAAQRAIDALYGNDSNSEDSDNVSNGANSNTDDSNPEDIEQLHARQMEMQTRQQIWNL